MRWKPFRITELWAKIAYVLVGWFLVPVSLGTVMTRLGVPDLVVTAALLALAFLVVWLGTRAFRVQGEPVEPPRVHAVSTLPIAAFYLHSSMRLVRGDAPVPPKPRRDDDLALIDRKRRF